MKICSFNKDYNSVFDACEKAVKQCGFKIKSSSRKEGCIDATVKGSLISWGESIEIGIKKNSAVNTKVRIISESKAQLIDWGTNHDNEKDLIYELKKILK